MRKKLYVTFWGDEELVPVKSAPLRCVLLSDGVLRGAGDMTLFTVANLVNLGLRVVLAVTLAPRFGIQFVWMAVPVGWLVNYLISFFEYRTGRWRRAK